MWTNDVEDDFFLTNIFVPQLRIKFLCSYEQIWLNNQNFGYKKKTEPDL